MPCLVEQPARLPGRPERIVGPRLGELQRSVLDVSLAADELGWRPERSLEEGLAETWHWIERA